MDQQSQKTFTRDDAYKILKKYMTNQNLIKHSLAAEAAMMGIYNKLFFGKPEYSDDDRIKWGITGLLHDADYEMSKGQPEKHGLLLFEKEPDSIPADIAHAIKAHNPDNGFKPEVQLDWGIRCADQLTGLVVAATLVSPDKLLAFMTPEFVMKRMNEKNHLQKAQIENLFYSVKKNWGFLFLNS